MTKEKREELVKFCVWATAYLHDVDESIVEESKFTKMSDDELQREADWLDNMLDK